MALKKSELYSSLWSSCDELRGGMDAGNTRITSSSCSSLNTSATSMRRSVCAHHDSSRHRLYCSTKLVHRRARQGRELDRNRCRRLPIRAPQTRCQEGPDWRGSRDRNRGARRQCSHLASGINRDINTFILRRAFRGGRNSSINLQRRTLA
jgi:hypothetical protein